MVKKTYIDISVPISKKLPLWPGTPKISFKKYLSLEKGDRADDTIYSASVHVGTHIDAPRHYFAGAQGINDVPLDVFIGEVFVLDVGDSDVITKEYLDQACIPKGNRRILFRTKNSELWNSAPETFSESYVSLSECGAQWIVNHNYKLVGIDYLSIERYHGSGAVHRILLENNVCILEALDLTQATKGRYMLYALPLKIEKIEASPVRAVLIPYDQGENNEI